MLSKTGRQAPLQATMSAGGISPAKVGWNRDRHRPDMGDGDFFIFGGLLCQKMEMFLTQSRNFIA
ncbi:MAG: hypothetical protein ACK2UN_18125, partial [Candidatus Promineifilaceae bacterium]